MSRVRDSCKCHDSTCSHKTRNEHPRKKDRGIMVQMPTMVAYTQVPTSRLDPPNDPAEEITTSTSETAVSVIEGQDLPEDFLYRQGSDCEIDEEPDLNVTQHPQEVRLTEEASLQLINRYKTDPSRNEEGQLGGRPIGSSKKSFNLNDAKKFKQPLVINRSRVEVVPILPPQDPNDDPPADSSDLSNSSNNVPLYVMSKKEKSPFLDQRVNQIENPFYEYQTKKYPTQINISITYSPTVDYDESIISQQTKQTSPSQPAESNAKLKTDSRVSNMEIDQTLFRWKPSAPEIKSVSAQATDSFTRAKRKTNLKDTKHVAEVAKCFTGENCEWIGPKDSFEPVQQLIESVSSISSHANLVETTSQLPVTVDSTKSIFLPLQTDKLSPHKLEGSAEITAIARNLPVTFDTIDKLISPHKAGIAMFCCGRTPSTSSDVTNVVPAPKSKRSSSQKSNK